MIRLDDWPEGLRITREAGMDRKQSMDVVALATDMQGVSKAAELFEKGWSIEIADDGEGIEDGNYVQMIKEDQDPVIV